MRETKSIVSFPLGRTVATTAALDALAKAEDSLSLYLMRHAIGDWGELDAEDNEANEQAVLNGGRLFSSYLIPKTKGEKLWIITEADRSITTLLLPEDY